jgi:transposase
MPLQKMAAWLAELGVTDAAMGSTGVYWRPACHALAGAGIEVWVCNAAHMRDVPGRKRDIADCQWIAELHEHGLLRASFVPAAEVAALRARTRYPQAADRAADRGGAAAFDGAGGRRDQDRPRRPAGCRANPGGR